MLSISNVGSNQAASYYSKDGYYVRNDDKDNTWQGQLKDDLELPNNVTKEHFDMMIKERKERAGYDLCFSAPKSVSIAMCIDDETRKDMVEAHNRAVEETLNEIEKREIGARITKDGTTEHIKTGNMLCGKFNHYVSRNNDPQLHTHAVILNQTKYNNKLYAVDNGDLYKNKILYGQIYRNKLSAELMHRGYDVECTDKEKGFFELKDIKEEIRECFSTRRKEIVEAMKLYEKFSPEHAALAAIKTRAAKTHKDMNELTSSWKETVNEMGGITLNKAASPITRENKEHITEYKEAINNASKREFAFTEKNLKTKILAANVANGISEVEVVHMMKQDKELVHLGKREVSKDKETYITTKSNIEIEKNIYQEIQSTKNTMKGMSKDEIGKKLDNFRLEEERLAKSENREVRKLSEEQQRAIIEITTTKDKYFAVQGLAGTGKTFMLDYARQAYEQEGYTVKGACFTGKAAEGLEKDAKIPSTTIHSHLNKLEREAGNSNPKEDMQNKTNWNFEGLQKTNNKEVWIIDEASLVDNNTMNNLLKAAQIKEAKVVFVGDSKQLLPVGAGNAYGNVVEKKQIGTVKIEDIRRQKNETLLESVKESVKGDINKSFKLLENRIQEESKPKKRIEKIVNDYMKLNPSEQKETVILTAGNSDRRKLNNQIREKLQAKDILPKGELYTVKDQQGKVSQKEFSVGDKVIFLQNDKKLEVMNGQTGKVEETKNNIMKIRSGDKLIEVNVNKYDKIDHGYAMTTYKAQGITVDRVLINIDSEQKKMNTRNAYYVDISRARHEVTIYTDDKEKIKNQMKDFADKVTLDDFKNRQQQTKTTEKEKKSIYEHLKDGLKKSDQFLRSKFKEKDFKILKNHKENTKNNNKYSNS